MRKPYVSKGQLQTDLSTPTVKQERPEDESGCIVFLVWFFIVALFIATILS